MKKSIRLFAQGALMVCALAALPDRNQASPAATQGQNEVIITSNKFEPKKLTVEEGTTVTWINKEGSHTVRSDSDSFVSKTLKPNDTFSYQFNKAGNYPYHCGFHGSRGGGDMSGTIVVIKKR